MDLKQTLTMPKTNFEMRGNLAIKEPAMVKNWEENNLYELLLAKNEGKEDFMLHDGPPYANGNIHCGHMLNHLLKDIVIRLKAMEGYKTIFIPGWDTHGLPIENMITKKGINRKTTPINEFRKKCEEYAKEQVNLQMEQVRRLGVLGDFAHKYMTLDHDYEAKQIEIFANMALKGMIFKGLKPVHWSPSSESALAEAEIEYEDVTSTAIYVVFNVIDGKGILEEKDKFVIWTTTPWTIPANLAISLNPEYDYGLYETEKGRFILLASLAEKLKDELGFIHMVLVKKIKGQELEFIKTKHPFYDRESIIIVGGHVTDDAGTGCVHTAPGHGEDDFKVGMKYGLIPLCPVDSKGYMTEEAGTDLQGLFYEEANEVILQKLSHSNCLLRKDKITHSYPHDWRTGKPLIFRATPQWFCSIVKIKDKLLNEVQEIKWKPAWGELRIHNMIKDRGDWCISRQRAWGVPIPIIYGEDDTPLIEKEVFDHIAKLFANHGSNIWFEKEAKDLLPSGYKSSHSPHGIFRKETDIMDVWFDSGSSAISVLQQRGLKYPADLYLEGSDQYRGWFNSSLIISTSVNGVVPYKSVVTHGFIQDSAGEKMSKSKGNGVDPMKMCNVYGADILRLWVATVDYQSDVRFGEDMVKQTSETYRKIRNTFKYLLGSLHGFDKAKDRVDCYELVDTYILATLERVKNNAINAMNNYDFSNAIMGIMNFIAMDLSSFYLDLIKDVLYCNSLASLRRKQVLNVLDQVFNTLLRLLSPVLSFTTEEAYSFYPYADKKYAALLDYPTLSNEYGEEVYKDYQKFLKIRTDILKALEISRSKGIIGSPQEAYVKVNIHDKGYQKVLMRLDPKELARLFVVSEVILTGEKLPVYECSEVEITRHLGHKCDRCWNYVSDGHTHEDSLLCPRCQKVVEENGE